jgi:protocatechuate 3,4-dioxygenase beta subunit
MNHWGRDVLLTRRGIIAGAAGLLVATAGYANILPTPRQTMGPFYPRRKPSDSDTDLTQINGHTGKAQGQVIEVSGRVLSLKGKPLSGAVVEIWQADSNGRYHHPFDTNSEKRDENFQGYGAVKLGADGLYRFRTIRPRYYDTGAGVRTPHIHFRVINGQGAELVTQMYFPGEKLNGQDFILQSLPSDNARTAVTARQSAGDAHHFQFDLVVG